jgi:iron(III) transport system permease protein
MQAEHTMTAIAAGSPLAGDLGVFQRRAAQGPAHLAFWWAVAGLVACLVLPWYTLSGSVWNFSWLAHLGSKEAAPALWQAFAHKRPWLLAVLVLLAAVLLISSLPALKRSPRQLGKWLIVLGFGGFAYVLLQGLAIGARGISTGTGAGFYQLLFAGLVPKESGQFGIGLGACIAAYALLMIGSIGLAARGYFRAEPFVAACVVSVAMLVAVFTFWPLFVMLISGVQDADGAFSLPDLFRRVFNDRMWSLGCVTSGTRCGVAWNTLVLGLLCAFFCTSLGLIFALIVTRTSIRGKRIIRALTVLPIITPPFVIGLGLILLLGRAGIVNHFLEWAFAVQPTRWIYGMQGVLLAQVFAFTPVAFLILIGVVEGISPSVEEAAQTLRADRSRTFRDISLPLMMPGIVNAFLVSFIESLADFGNPIVLGGNFAVLATEIYFSIVGAQLDQGRAAAMALVLLVFTLLAFFLQRWILGKKSYVTVAGKGDSGLALPLPDGVRRLSMTIAVPWIIFTVVIYLMALAGGFVKTWGRDNSFTLDHYIKAFGIEYVNGSIIWAGAAWNSFFTTIQLSAIAAPLTTVIGILTAYLLTRQTFAGQKLFEFGTMLSFAIPGTVIGVSYILAFNVPPIEITGTAMVLIMCFVFRNMPVGVRAGIAAMSQLDKSLDEASLTLRASGFTTLRKVVLPLLKPAIVGSLIYSFVRAVTTVSAVIFLVTAEYEMATTYIINRVVNGDYGVAIAYCSALIVLMLVMIGAIQFFVGERKLGRRASASVSIPGGSA